MPDLDDIRETLRCEMVRMNEMENIRSWNSRRIESIAAMSGIVLLLSAALSVPASAQEATHARSEWYNVGLSGARPPLGAVERKIPNFNLSYNFGWDTRFYQVGLDYFGSLSLNEPPFVYAVSVSKGRRSVSNYHLAALSVGPALVAGRWAHGWKADDEGLHKEAYLVLSPGLVMDVQLLVKPFGFIAPELGAGIELYGNLNFHRSFYGIRLVLHGNNTR